MYIYGYCDVHFKVGMTRQTARFVTSVRRHRFQDYFHCSYYISILCSTITCNGATEARGVIRWQLSIR